MSLRLHRLAAAVERMAALDKPGTVLADAVGRVVRRGPLKDVLSGTWLGHPLHPLLTDVPIGAWTSALVLDLAGGLADSPDAVEATRDGARRLVGVGVFAALPTVAAGLTDYADTQGAQRRVGTLHAVFNSAALACYVGSWLARRRGRHAVGVGLGLAGASAATAGGFLGGHLAYAQGVGVDNTTFDAVPREWTPVLDEQALTTGQLVAADLDGGRILLTRTEHGVVALADTCSHRGGPLAEGTLDGDCVVCPWHGSTFRLDDGSVVRGPATAPQPAYEVRVREAKIEIRATG